ncbi:MAG: hypothetical protein ISS48_02580 [Candidatus Aenigmarchaeota archaeon]|nr:hypothetical protein [Candidatus Aenigmarchaeota archaeon]
MIITQQEVYQALIALNVRSRLDCTATQIARKLGYEPKQEVTNEIGWRLARLREKEYIVGGKGRGWTVMEYLPWENRVWM